MTLASRAAALAAVGSALAATLACVPAPEEPEPATAGSPAGYVPFDYVTLDGSHVNSQTTKNRVTVVVFLTTYDLPSQVIMRELTDLMHRVKPRFNALAVALEPPNNAPLVEAFASTLELPFPVAMNPVPGSFDMGVFGKVDEVPTTVVLDRNGRERFRRSGAIPAEMLQRVLEDSAD